MARYKDEVLLAGEKHHREVVGLKEELRQLNEKFRNQLAHTQIYHNDLAKNKEELGRVNAIHQNQLAMAQMHHRESEKLQRDLSQTRKEMTEAVEKHGKELAAAREQSAVVNDQHVKELERTKKKADEAIQKHMLESLNARQEASKSEKSWVC
uniref:Uncharacterized protein n=1 Tax=Ditylenchus dipsaci TaxID=166011 RepID=A0A915DSU2_9BILA